MFLVDRDTADAFHVEVDLFHGLIINIRRGLRPSQISQALCGEGRILDLIDAHGHINHFGIFIKRRINADEEIKRTVFPELDRMPEQLVARTPVHAHSGKQFSDLLGFLRCQQIIGKILRCSCKNTIIDIQQLIDRFLALAFFIALVTYGLHLNLNE